MISTAFSCVIRRNRQHGCGCVHHFDGLGRTRHIVAVVDGRERPNNGESVRAITSDGVALLRYIHTRTVVRCHDIFEEEGLVAFCSVIRRHEVKHRRCVVHKGDDLFKRRDVSALVHSCVEPHVGANGHRTAATHCCIVPRQRGASTVVGCRSVGIISAVRVARDAHCILCVDHRRGRIHDGDCLGCTRGVSAVINGREGARYVVCLWAASGCRVCHKRDGHITTVVHR